MAIPHYPYLLLKMLGPHGMLSLRGNLKGAFDYDIQAIQIAAKALVANGIEEITTITAQMNPEELEIPAKNSCVLTPPKETNVKKIDLGTGDPEKTVNISAHLWLNRNSCSPTFFGTTKISLYGNQSTCQVSQESWLSIESMSIKAPNKSNNG
jgi:Tfp pilus assembly protein PilX